MSLSPISAIEPKSRASDAKARASDPTNMCYNWKPGVLRPDSELGRTVEHADQELLGDMVRSGATVEHALDALTQHLDHSPVLIAAGLVLCQRPPVAWQLVERRSRPF